MEKTNKELAIDFLLFSYFGTTSDNDAEHMIAASIEKAYADATLQGAYNTSQSAKSSNNSVARNEGASLIRNSIDELKLIRPEGSKKCEFDAWHDKTCKALREKYRNNGLDDFTYGNAQKWINMTLKYLYILYLLTEKDELSFIGQLSDVLHVPVDRYIIQAVWENTAIPLPITRFLRNGARGAYEDNKVKAWSSWDIEPGKDTCEQYQVFQKGIFKHYGPSPIDWEGKAWIKQRRRK